MSADTTVAHPIGADALLALAADELSELEAARINHHLTVCRACRQQYSSARELQRSATRLGDGVAAGVDDLTHRRLWRALAPEAARAVQRVRQRQAWRIVLRSAKGRLAAAAVFLVLLGATVLIFTQTRRGSVETLTRSAAPAVDGVVGSQPSALGGGLVATPDVTPPLKHGLALQLRQVTRPRGVGRPAARQHLAKKPVRTRTLRAARTPPPPTPIPSPGAAPVLTPRAGETPLRCGGVVALGGGGARVVRDSPRSATIRLSTGRVSLRVPKLPPRSRVEVTTADARVRVVGTRFTVTRTQKSGTTVAVSEGTVWVTPTGRNRKTHVLRAGTSRTVLGETALLGQLAVQLSEALARGQHHRAARVAERYLSIVSRPSRPAALKLKLAAIYVRLGRHRDAERMYRDVARSAPQSVARQNALAFLARFYGRRGKSTRAKRVWQALLKLYPGGAFSLDALMQLVRSTCKRMGPAAVGYRRRLIRRFPGHAAAKALVARCGP